MTRSSSISFSSLVQLLYTQNPFYLIGTFLILFGLQQCFGNDESLSASGLLVVLLGAYTLLLAGAAAVIIRCGQVWDDARTILLVIVLLFFMLSASLDVHLLHQPLAGTFLLGAGLAFSLLVSEGLLRTLKIGLAARYRGPFYLMLAILFLYPLAPAWISYFRLYAARSWVLFAFPSVAAMALLTLLPAARTPRHQEPATGTPWRWPYYPWSLFVYLTIGLAIRSWWLAFSFEPAQENDGYFQPYFLLPLLLAWSALVLEMGQARRSSGAIAAGLLLPLPALVLGFIGPGKTLEQIAFLERLAMLGTPAQLAVWSLLLYYLWAWLRNVRAAEGFLIVLGLLASVVGRGTFDWWSLSSPHPLPLTAVALGLFVMAIRHQSSWRAIAAGAMVAAGLRFAGAGLTSGVSDVLLFWQWHAPLIALLAVTAIFKDELACELRKVAWRAAPALALVAAIVYPWAMPQLDPIVLAGYLWLLLLVSVALWGRQKEVAPLSAALITAAANLLANVQHVYWLLAQTPLAEGLPWLAGGMIAVAVAFVISLLKMGLAPWAWQWLSRVNLALGGAPGKA
jgi:hypothetical protein